ncbi:dihydroorotate dehydrogenase electron transfer subunit, partial [bacterium]|nr:dihydroorotate dehydrogenase electron transfer subunit [bacterium]
SFCLSDDFETGIIVAGGIGVAPFKMLYKSLFAKGKKVLFYYGVRNKDFLYKIPQVDKEVFHFSTDDGSEGFKGFVSQLLEKDLSKRMPAKPRIFACGPNVMLRAVSKVAEKFGIPCEVSLESVMACGLGVCQACVVTEKTDGSYKLICSHGPIFNASEVDF